MDLYQLEEKTQTNRTLNLLRLLWQKFKIQPLQYQLITLLVMFITTIFMTAFYSSFMLWQAFLFLMTRVLLRGVEWYLEKS